MASMPPIELGLIMQQDANKSKPKTGVNFLHIGSGQMFTSMVIAGFIVGYGIDYLLGTTPIFMMACGVLGVIGGSQKVHRLLQYMDKTQKGQIKEQSKDADAN
ncbi:AtpZ/AtpI family protein [Thiomicrospira sp.]|uniref:AtpZ/AtpI family protein n=1 Tax=Thiomicrospira sp. TaxID=935 RepID=UPI002F94F5FB